MDLSASPPDEQADEHAKRRRPGKPAAMLFHLVENLTA
jgi:hypothetical protein